MPTRSHCRPHNDADVYLIPCQTHLHPPEISVHPQKTSETSAMVALRNFRHQIADSVRRLLRSPRHSPTRLFFRRKGDLHSDMSTPNSTRSVSFTEALSWPYIDDDVPDE